MDREVAWRTADQERLTNARVAAVQDAERLRIARDLHDSTGQQLLAISLAVTKVRALAAPAGETARAFDELTQLVLEAQGDIRTLSFVIHPLDSIRQSAGAAVRSLAEGFARRAGVTLDLDVRLPARRLCREDEHILFRMVQEALLNVHRHAAANHVRVMARCTRGIVRCEVEDNGRGVPARQTCLFGEGLRAMRSRVQQRGGTLSLRRARPNGTSLRASWPARFCDEGDDPT